MINNRLLHTFTINHLSEDGTRYEGAFTTKKLTIRDMTQLGVRRTQLCGGLHYDPATPGQGLDASTFQINSMIAHLELSLVKFPVWWNLDELTDLEVLSEVYKEVISFENNFPGSRGAASGAGHREGSQGSSQTPQAGTNVVGPAQPVVVGQVSTSLEP